MLGLPTPEGCRILGPADAFSTLCVFGLLLVLLPLVWDFLANASSADNIENNVKATIISLTFWGSFGVNMIRLLSLAVLPSR